MARISRETIKAEIRKCGQDPAYFLKNYVKISHPLKGLIPFTTYNFQMIYLMTLKIIDLILF